MTSELSIHARIRNLQESAESFPSVLPALDMLVADRNEAVYNAARSLLGEAFGGLCDSAPGFTCYEVELFADLFRAVGFPDSAETFIERHSDGDDADDEHFMYVRKEA